MARIRTIKPDAFTSDSLTSVSVAARWTFAGLWTYADDYGRARDDLRLIKAALFVLDDTVSLQTLETYLKELETDHICRYVVDGKRYLHMPTWSSHQRVSHPTDSRFPPCPEHLRSDSRTAPESLRNGSGSRTNDSSGKGKEGKGKEGKGTRSARAHTLPDSWRPTDKHRAKAKALELNVGEQADAFRDHFKANGKKYVDWDAAFGGWMRRSAQWADGGPKAPAEAKPRSYPPLEVPDHIDPNNPKQYAEWLRSVS